MGCIFITIIRLGSFLDLTESEVREMSTTDLVAQYEREKARYEIDIIELERNMREEKARIENLQVNIAILYIGFLNFLGFF